MSNSSSVTLDFKTDKMPLIAYLDETGDHSLTKEDPDYPIFGLVMLVCDFEVYCGRIVPAVFRLKFDFWAHESIILHSYDIRKCKGNFEILRNPGVRGRFYDGINAIMSESDYRLIPVVIRKKDHKERYGIEAESPYDLALKFALDGLASLLETSNQDEILIIAEARGKREDDELRSSFQRIIRDGTDATSSTRFGRLRLNLHFIAKCMNVVGTQMADLAAYPIGRSVSHPERPNPAFDVIKHKFYRGTNCDQGLLVYP